MEYQNSGPSDTLKRACYVLHKQSEQGLEGGVLIPHSPSRA